MCRFICYKGNEVLLADLLYKPRNSLILQSYKAKERKEPLNGDGFGVGWYTPAITPTPCVFTSLTPAWSNQNLRRLSEHIKSPCFFAHVRAASPGMRVADENCHPFQFGKYLFMHNGGIEHFNRIKRQVVQSLPDNLYHAIGGTTDSEYAFAVFLNLLGDTDREISTAQMGNALVGTIERLEQWTLEAGIQGPSYYNFAVTDGQSIAAVRYVSDQRLEPISLYYSTGKKYASINGEGLLLEANQSEQAVIIASERLTERNSDWVRVAPNHLLTITPAFEVKVELMKVERLAVEQ
jgi:predicted glutamine amidotransferase